MAQILVVDDLEQDSQALVAVLRQAGYDVIIARSGEEGIEMALKHKPNLILMDVVLPGISGFQATRKITKHPEISHIPVIIVSSKSTETDRVWGLRQGAKDYFTKPVDKKAILPTIKTLLG